MVNASGFYWVVEARQPVRESAKEKPYQTVRWLLKFVRTWKESG
jgi:hypothetical protein